MPRKAGTSKHLNRVVAAGEKRALDLEPKLVEVLAPILDDAGDRAAREFESRVTALAASALTSRDILCLLSFGPDEGRALVASLALTADAGVRRNSAMIAVKPRPEEAAALAHDGGHEPDDLHVTLAYLGSYDGPLSALAEALAPVAADHAPLEGKVAGRGAFENNGKGAPLILLPSVPGLVELRVAATQALVEAGFDYGRDYGYLPHMTVDYTPEDRMPDAERVGKPLHFDELLIVRGNDEVVKLPLVGAPPMTAAAGEDRRLSDALGSVDDARRHLATALHASDEAGVKDAQKALGDAEKRLSRELQAQGEHKNKRAKSADEIADQVGQAQASQVAEVEQQTGGEGARGSQLAKQVVEKGAEEQRIEEGIASEIERLTDRPVSEVARHLQENLARPLAGRADWISPLADEIVNVTFLIEELRSKTDPVRQAVSETMVRTAVEGAGIEFDVNNPLASKVLARSASQITNIAETTQLNVMRIIKAAHDEGLSIPDTAAAIRGGMRDASTVRATLIARTELAAAVNGGSLAAAQIVSDALDEPYYKQWLTAPGARYPRHEDYEGLDEQTQRLDEAFDVSGVALQFPGDPDGPPEEVCNCRCTIVYLTPEEAAEQGVDLGGESQKPTPATPEEAEGLARPLFDEIDQGVPVPKPDMDLPNMVLATRVAEGNWTAGAHDLDQFIGPGAYYSDHRLASFLDDLPEGESDLGMTIKATKATNEQGEPIITLDHLGKAGPIIQTGGLDETAKRLANFLDKENAGRGTPKVGGMFQRAGEMSLSKTEADTIVRWTRHEYEDIEVALRDRKPITRAQQVVVDRLDRVLDQAPMLEGDPLYRGYQRLGTPLPKVGEQIQIGRGGFAATTSSGDLASTFGDVVYRVEGPTQAFPVQGLSAKPEELEYLSPRSQRFEVTKIGAEKFASGERTVIDVRAIPRPGMPVGEKVFTADPEVAAKAIASGVPVVLSQPTQIATLIDDLGKIAKQAQAKGEAAPRLNLGSVSVPGTNLFTQESIGVPRVEMPQLKGVPTPGSLADKLERDSRGEVDIAPLFYRHLQDEGTQIEYGVERRVDQLRATQTELDGGKVAGIMDYLDGGGEIEGAIPVTADGYVIDGHHRWAAVTGLDFKYNADKPWEIDTDIVHKDITSVVSEANIFAAEYGIPQAGITATVDTAKAEATIGITPFRPEDTALGFYDTMKAKQFESDIVPTAEQYGVTVSRQERVSGVWEGESEPSYSLLAHDGKEGVENFAATMRAKYNQDGVMVFAPNPNGESYAYTIHRVNPEEVTPMLSEYGIQGATVSADGITIMGDEALADNVTELATKINRVVTARRGDLAFVERNDPVRSIGEINAKHPLVDLYTSEKPEGITVSMIRVPIEARGKGEASAAMSDVLDYADRKGLPVALTPEAISGGMSTTQLKAWYKRLGFEPNKGRTADLRFKESMIRRPADIGLARPSFDPAGFVNTKIEATDIIIAGLERQLAKAPDSISLQTELRRAHARKDTFVGLRDHPNPLDELDAISSEMFDLEVKVEDGTITADEQAQLSKLDEQARSLKALGASKEYTELLEGAIAERAKAGDVSMWSGEKIKREQAKVEAKVTSAAALMREKLKAKGENEPIAVEPHAAPWSISGPYEMGSGVAWRQNGIVYTAELPTPTTSIEDAATLYQGKVAPWVGELPPEIRGRLDRVNIFNGKSPDEEYWSRVYGNPGSILAQTGNKAVTVWHSNDEVATKSLTQSTFEHEAGHLMFEGGGPLDEDEWITAANADSDFGRMKYGVKSGDYIYGNTPDSFRGFMVGVRGVSDYAASSLVEDWAESIRLFLLDRRIGSIGTLAAVHEPGGFDEIVTTPLPKGVSGTEPVRFGAVYPNRDNLIREWLGLP